jgi:hypothetical protein
MVPRESQYAPGYELHAVSRYDRKALEIQASNKQPLFSLTVRIVPTSHGPADPAPVQSSPVESLRIESVCNNCTFVVDKY